MLSFSRSTVIVLPLLLAAGGGTPAAAQEMLGGFFNRFLPGGSPAPQAAPPPAPVVVAKPVPAEPAPVPTDSNPFNEHRGGLIDAMNGQDAGCTGILCTFMGGERDPRPAGPPPMTGARAEVDEADVMAPRHAAIKPPPERRCVDTTDPWRCYR